MGEIKIWYNNGDLRKPGDTLSLSIPTLWDNFTFVSVPFVHMVKPMSFSKFLFFSVCFEGFLHSYNLYIHLLLHIGNI